MFLIRTAFWLSVLIFLIPVNEESLPPAVVEGEAIGAIEAVGAAQATLDDMGGFCARNPDVCDVGGRVAHTFALKARTGALWVYDVLDRQLGGTGQPEAPGDGPTGTLTDTDLEPEWSAPVADNAI